MRNGAYAWHPEPQARRWARAARAAMDDDHLEHLVLLHVRGDRHRVVATTCLWQGAQGCCRLPLERLTVPDEAISAAEGFGTDEVVGWRYHPHDWHLNPAVADARVRQLDQVVQAAGLTAIEYLVADETGLRWVYSAMGQEPPLRRARSSRANGRLLLNARM